MGSACLSVLPSCHLRKEVGNLSSHICLCTNLQLLNPRTSSLECKYIFTLSGSSLSTKLKWVKQTDSHNFCLCCTIACLKGQDHLKVKVKVTQSQSHTKVKPTLKWEKSIVCQFWLVLLSMCCVMYIISTMPLKKFVQGDGSIATNFTFATPSPVKFLNPRQISAGTCTPSQLMDTPRWSQVPSLQCAHPPHPSPPAVPPDETLHTLVLYSLMNFPSNVRKPEWRFPGGERGVCGSGPTRHPPNTGVSHPGHGTWPCMYIMPVSTTCKYTMYLCWAMLIAFLKCVLFDESSVIDMFTIYYNTLRVTTHLFAKHFNYRWSCVLSLVRATGNQQWIPLDWANKPPEIEPVLA